MTTIQDIARRLGVTKGTVSKALNGAPDISETLQKQILETAVEMGYTRLRRQKGTAPKLCILAASQNMEYQKPHQFGYEVVLGFRQMAEPQGYQVDVIPVDQASQRQEPYDVFMLKNHYQGSFVIGFSLADPWMQEFETSRTPAVLYDNHVLANPSTAYVGVDNDEGMALAVSHLKELGHQKIGYLNTSPDSYIMQVRRKAFSRAMRQNGLCADSACTGPSSYISQCLDEHLPRFLEEGMTALICSHDLIAQAALVRCQEMGLRVPEDFSVIGFDDLPLCPYTSPPLTTLRQDRIQLGKSAYYALNSLMNGVSIGTLLLHTELIIRASTAPPGK